MRDKPGNAEICKRLTEQFNRMSSRRKDVGKPICAYKRGGSIRLRYAGWTSTVDGGFAWEYLQWLEDGHTGDHFDFFRVWRVR